MVDSLLDQGVVRSPRIAQALLEVPRHLFLPAEDRASAYADAPAPIGSGQTITAPHMVAMMCEALQIAPGEKVLEVGTGSGYHAAVLATLASPGGHVTSVERVPTLAAEARRRLATLPLPVRVVDGDGSEGRAEDAPYDAISVAAAAPALPPPLADQLAPGGRIVIPVGGPFGQELTRYTKRADGTLTAEPRGRCLFVPLVGRHGFPQSPF